MPLETRAPDTFSKDNLLLGFSQVEFTPIVGGVAGTPVALGILSGEELQKEVNVLELNDGSAGTVTVAREVLSSLKPSFQFELFNFHITVAQYIFGAEGTTEVTADASASVPNEPITIPVGADAARTFISLINGDIDDQTAVLTLTSDTITEVILGDGTGDTPGDYKLAYKPLLFSDVSAATQTNTSTGVLVRTFSIVDTTSAGATELGVNDGVIAASGELDMTQVMPAGDQLNVTYLPTHNLEEDFDAADPDMLLDPLLGRIRFPNLDTFAAPDATSPLRQGQPVLLDYEFNQKASNTLQPFTQGGGSFSGSAVIKHLPDIGINFIWNIPSVSIRIDDNALTFGSDDFGIGTLVMNINDAGGTDRFGIMTLADEVQAGS
jgi:hypothetical protein